MFETPFFHFFPDRPYGSIAAHQNQSDSNQILGDSNQILGNTNQILGGVIK